MYTIAHAITNCFGAVLTIGLMHRLVNFFKLRSKRFSAIVDGPPLVLLEAGKWRSGIMRKMRMQDTEVMAASRTKGARTLDQVEYAILERNGAISIMKKRKLSDPPLGRKTERLKRMYRRG